MMNGVALRTVFGQYGPLAFRMQGLCVRSTVPPYFFLWYLLPEAGHRGVRTEPGDSE